MLRVRWEDASAVDLKEEVSEFAVLCKNIRVSINSYTEADTFKLEIDYRQLPFDPRLMRAIGVTIAMEDTKRVYANDNSLLRVTPVEKGPDRNIIFQGFADEERISFDDTKRTVSIEGRDFTSLFIDKKYLGQAINLEKKVDEVLQDILSSMTDTQAITLENQVVDDKGNAVDLPVLAKFWGEKDALSGKRSSRKDESYWDVIQDIVRRAGMIAYIELDKLVLAKPRNIYDKKKAKRFVYGKNLINLEFNRKIGRRRGFNILVRSLNLNTKEIIEAKIPLEATDEWSKATGIANTEVKLKKLNSNGTAPEQSQEEPAPYLSFLVGDVTSKDHLIEIGQQNYEEIGRQELEGSFETAEMATSDAVNQEFNLLHLRNGTPVEIFINQGDMKALNLFYDSNKQLLEKKRRDEHQAQVAKYLTDKGWPPRIAQSFSKVYGLFGNIFYTKSVEFTLDSERGFRCKVDFINFIEQKKVEK